MTKSPEKEGPDTNSSFSLGGNKSYDEPAGLFHVALRSEPLIRVKPESKEPVVDAYAIEPTERVAEWVLSGGNAGLALAETDVVVVDIDGAETAQTVAETLPESFTVKTSNGWHRYYRCAEWDRNTELAEGSIRSDGWMVVVPPSKHPDGVRYSVVNDEPIAEVAEEALERLIPASERDPDPPAPSSRRSVDSGDLDTLDRLIDHDGYRAEVRDVLDERDPAHDRRVWLAGFLLDAVGLSVSETAMLIYTHADWGDLDRAETERQVASVAHSIRGDRR